MSMIKFFVFTCSSIIFPSICFSASLKDLNFYECVVSYEFNSEAKRYTYANSDVAAVSNVLNKDLSSTAFANAGLLELAVVSDITSTGEIRVLSRGFGSLSFNTIKDINCQKISVTK